MSPPKSCEINGPRPSPLLINNDSRAIHKPHHRQPVIIYTHSPKIIHTQPKDFMALVQRLTGFTRPNDNDSSSVLTQENSANDVQESSSYGSPKKVDSNNMFLADFPLFTPRSSELLFGSSLPALRHADGAYASPGAGGSSLSPSLVEFLKGLPEF